MIHRSSEGGIFDFSNNFRSYRKSGAQINREATAIRKRREGEHTVGNGHFIKLEKLRDTHRRALLKILEGAGIIAVIVCATVAGIGSLEGCGRSAQKDDVSSVSEDVVSKISNVLTEEGGVVL